MSNRTEEHPEPPARRARGWRWMHAVTDRVPTSWLSGIATAVLLAVTAAFGGLAAVAAPPVAELSAGETHENAQFALTVERAVLIDELPDAGITVEPGERVLAVVVTAENRWDRTQPALGRSGVQGAVRLPELGDAAEPESIARFDDAGTNPSLQPRVPAELVLAWAVDAGTFAAGDELTFELRDFSLYSGQLVTEGESWWDPVVAATVSVELTDVGAGVDASGDETTEEAG